ncbi:methylenetetrahydrofolate reductase [Buchnera aphidicola str. APS (Acyrthosiphon pisum)]|uniref:5,10-methylenetetrahydrofolate reductase n=1 Tax=Buchnera aphidicola subsp. Acyrthosiphon pisum (strain APS) TaxID=107806 RepID=METF_BUCAI|nr:methylenetetrahydrofolate reductase [Buchnera aphidicola]P57154.1 RecName: Full=5,10-methylenetetrahydrofolate reductase [Buchnera aphidicola str. APS (Acyrthosiphon pisum)]pir/A84935/ 5,10-methylenetetrahydrofolate reductase (FADH2) (EC 1.7.99.5) [imported] - Buchnera sp. (strain APS) [Buchnera sp. (in: enterobacteria)]ADP67606.1 5,10-methylenetetrahydrofolate reductase [Buchnera aphidicola str. JF98 (Acyrthosiphon pisum)]ACL29873.1 5,10-methylenetetrahydrofolate reductase [Buchnera aphidic
MKNYSQYHQDIMNQKLENIRNNIQCSFEFFPPKNSFLEENLWSTVNRLSLLKPKFFSVTYGANTGEREKTYDTVQKIYKKTGIITAAHLTCIDSTPHKLKEIAYNYWNSGIKSIVALRGDTLEKDYRHTMYAVDLVLLLKKIADFDISVAAYPELHPESKNVKSDILNLKKKVDAGASRAITQFFFNIESYLRFRDNCIKNKINIDIIPGILPVCNFQKLKRFSSMTNVKIPKWMLDMFNGLDDDIFTQKIIGSSIAIDMVKKLSCEGVKNFHFYTLNQSDITYSICHILGL